MAFWGVEVRPGKPYTHVRDEARGRLRISQATLGIGTGDSKSVVQCNVGKKSPILLCSLIPDKAETCHMELEFEESDDVVFSVLGLRSVHLSGYYIGCHHAGGDETDSYGEDIGEEDSESFGSHESDEDDYDSDFIDDGDMEMFPLSPKRKSSIIIEEIVEDDKPANVTRRRLKKKNQLNDIDDSNEDSQHQHVVKSNNSAILESEDEDGFPISFSLRKDDNKDAEENKKSGNQTVDEDRKRKIDAISQQNEPIREDDSNVISKEKRARDGKMGELTNIEKNHISDNHDGMDAAENDGRQKKMKKEKTKKDKKSCVGEMDRMEDEVKGDENSEMDRMEDEVKGDENEVLNSHVTEQVNPSEPEKLQNDREVSSSGKKKKNKKKRVKDGVAQERTGGITEECNLDNDGSKPQQSANKDNENENITVPELNKDEVPDDNGLSQKARKRKLKKGKSSDKDANTEESLKISETENNVEPQKTRTFANGLIVEELSMGKPDGKRASPGSMVSVSYIGKLKNGKIFDSNVGKKPFKFRLGVGHVIKGWDVGIAGMRVGDKRRLTIPPSMGYGATAAGKIPGNSWLVFDVEVVDVK